MNFSNLEKFLDYLTEWRIPGVDCTVHLRYKEIFRHQAGYSDMEHKIAMTPDRTYFLYSASKVVTCVAALQLYEQGKFLLTEPVFKYIPSFKDMYVKKHDGSLKKAEMHIKIRDLFTMCGGLTYDIWSPSIMKLRQDTDGNCNTAQVIDAIANEPLIFEPGTHWNYSLCHDVIGRLIEVVSGMTFGDYLQKSIFDPLEMSDTGFKLTSERVERLSSLYRYNDETDKVELQPKELVYKLGRGYESGGAGLISTVDDYIKFADMMANGGIGANGVRCISSAAIDLMRTNQLGETQLHDFNWEQMTGYGYGLGVRTLINKAVSGSLGSLGEFGWGGAAGAYVLIDPDSQLAVYFAQHMLNNQEPFIHPRIRNLVYASIK